MNEEQSKAVVIKIEWQGDKQTLNVSPTQTTDGITIFEIGRVDEELSQLRWSEDKWKQIWGNLSAEEIDLIGNAIHQHPELQV